MKIQDMLFTRVGVLLMSKVARGKKKNNSDCSFRLRFLVAGRRRRVSNSDFSRQQVWSNGSDVM